jgi:hypothetical protein
MKGKGKQQSHLCDVTNIKVMAKQPDLEVSTIRHFGTSISAISSKIRTTLSKYSDLRISSWASVFQTPVTIRLQTLKFPSNLNSEE